MKKNEKIVLGVLLIIVVIGILFEMTIDNTLLKQGRLTVGRINSEIGSAKGGTVYKYSFQVNTKLYKGKKGSANKGKVGKRYFVIYNPKDIKENRILLNLPVPDSIQKAPENGWSHLPTKPDNEHEIIKKGFK